MRLLPYCRKVGEHYHTAMGNVVAYIRYLRANGSLYIIAGMTYINSLNGVLNILIVAINLSYTFKDKKLRQSRPG